ncbi:MAG: ATP-binding cassette domain-containing protein [Promethearchaeota archaeon]|nr:MAG: ATP-binding cassette domain-containing protein [Candidatus Lokiarchaeota archaeon]
MEVNQKHIDKSLVFDSNDLAINIQNLVKNYDDVKAVSKLNLKIKNGELFSLLGPNGAGKTTTINILSGLLKPTQGKAFVGGYNILTELSSIKKLIGVCPQEAAIFKFLTGKENLELFGYLNGMSKGKIKERIDYLLELLEFEKDSERKTKEYSGGMLRKLNILIALIHDPKIAFLDEPTVGMDPRARRKVWDFIRALKNQNKTIILTTHYMEEAEALSDRVGVIDYGELIAIGTPKELIEKFRVKNLEEVFLKITGRRIVEGI